MKSKISNSQSARSLKVFRDPFSTKTLNAKIPDGSCTLSIGERNQDAVSFLIDEGVGWLFIPPSLVQSVWFPDISPFNGLDEDPDTSPMLDGTTESAYVGMGIDTNFNPPIYSAKTLTDWSARRFGTAGTDSQIEESVSKWRMVSRGVKITLEDFNRQTEGIFEVIRVSLGTTSEISDIQMVQTVLGTTRVGMIDDPSYMSGLLRDIDKYEFTLRPDGINHQFKSGHCYLDNGFSGLLFKFTGRATDDHSRSKLLVRICSNTEIIYSTDATLARFHTESQYEKDCDVKLAAKKHDVKAARRIKK